MHACTRCGTGVTLPALDEQDLLAAYPADYNAYALPANPLLRVLATILFRWRYWRGLRRLPLSALRVSTPGRLLDVGGGRGDLGVVLGGHGWQVTSLDPSEPACREARARGVDSVQGTLAGWVAEPARQYDAVVFQHSLEHVEDPAADLRVAASLLGAGGRLVITAPNFACRQRRWFGANWFHLDVPRHRVHLTPAGLETLLRRCGYEEIQVSTSRSADGFPMSVARRWLGQRFSDATNRYLAAVAAWVTAPLLALGRGAVDGDLLHAVARKPRQA